LVNGYNHIRGDAKTTGYGSGGGALVNWQWSANWRLGVQLGCADLCAGNAEIGYRAYTFQYKNYKLPERAIYYIIGLGIHEVWLRFVAGVNALSERPAQPGLGVGFSVHAFAMGNLFLTYGINFYLVNEYMAYGLGQAFIGIAYRL
jgi:hypothetical protein